LVGLLSLSALALAVALSSAPAAEAAGDPVFSFDPPAAQTVPHGHVWKLPVSLTNFSLVGTDFRVTIAGAGPAREAQVKLSLVRGQGASDITATGALFSYSDASLQQLPVGDYSVTISGTVTTTSDPLSSFPIATTGAARVTIVPLRITTTVAIVDDPNSPSNAIITLGMVGDMTGQIPPAGSWRVTATDKSGAQVFERTVDRPEPGLQAASTYWNDVKPDSGYTLSASYLPTGDTASNWIFTKSTQVSYVSQKAVTPTASSSASSQLPTLAPRAFSVPSWAVLVMVLAIVALLAVNVIFFFRRLNQRRRGDTLGRDELSAESY
jgi:hypothetical protein